MGWEPIADQAIGRAGPFGIAGRASGLDATDHLFQLKASPYQRFIRLGFVGKLNRLTFGVFVSIRNTNKVPKGGFMFSNRLALPIAEPHRWRDGNTLIAMSQNSKATSAERVD